MEWRRGLFIFRGYRPAKSKQVFLVPAIAVPRLTKTALNTEERRTRRNRQECFQLSVFIGCSSSVPSSVSSVPPWFNCGFRGLARESEGRGRRVREGTVSEFHTDEIRIQFPPSQSPLRARGLFTFRGAVSAKSVTVPGVIWVEKGTVRGRINQKPLKTRRNGGHGGIARNDFSCQTSRQPCEES